MLTNERIKDLEELGFEWTRSGEPTNRTLGTSSTQVNQENIEVDWIAAASDQSPLAPLPTTNKEGKSFLQEALELGFSSNYLANKTEDEARMLIHIVTTVRRRTQEESGLNASKKLFESIESALERGHSASFLVNKTEEEVQVISTQDPEKEIQSPPRKATARKPVDIMYPGNGNSISGCQPSPYDPYGNYCTMPSQNEEYEHDMSNDDQLVRTDPGMMITSYEQDEQPSEEHVSGGRTVGPCTCKNTKCLKLYCVCLASEEYCHDECNCNGCQNLPRHDAVRNEAILEILAKNRNAFNKNSNPCKCKNSFCLKKYCECFAAGRQCESSCKCINCKNYDGCEAPMAKSSEEKNIVGQHCGNLVHLPTNGEAEKSEAVVQRQYQIAESARKSNAKALAYFQHYGVQQYPSGYNPYYPYGHPQMIMPPAGEGYSTHQGGYPHPPSSRIDEPPTKDAESETYDSDATVPLNNNDYGPPIVHDPLEEDDTESSEDESDVLEDESEANYYNDDIHSENDGHSSDDDHCFPGDDSRIRRPSAISWMQKRGSSTSLSNRPKQSSSTQARGTDDVFNYWMAKKSSNQHLPVSNALRNQTTFDYRTNGVRQLASGNWEVSYNYHGARRSLSTYATLDQAELANKVGRTMLMATRDLDLTPEEIKHNILLARAAAQDAGGSTERSATSSEKRDSKSTIDSRHYLPAEAVEILKAWISSPEHVNNPYPTPEEVDDLLQQTGIDRKQLHGWFGNARAKLKRLKTQSATSVSFLPMDDKPTGISSVSTQKKRKHEDQQVDDPVLSEGRFDTWLANRKNEWAQVRHKKWKDSIHNEAILSLTDSFSDWLSSRKKTWEAIRQRKRRKIKSQQIDPLDHSMLPSPQRKTGKNLLPTEAVSILKDWMSEHIDNPYPTKEDKEELMKKTGVDGKQLRNWLNNFRASMKKKQSKHIKGLRYYGEEAVVTSTVSTEKKRKHEDQPIDDPLHSKEDFDGWLAKRKNEWNQNRQKKWKEQASLSSDTFSDWLSSRKSTWAAVRQRKRRRIQTQQSQHTDSQPKKTTIDYRTVGVRQTKSNTWEVGFRYQGSRRSLSTYATQDQAAIANEIGRKILMATKDSQLTSEEIEQNVKAARAAAKSAAQGFTPDLSNV